MRVVVKYVFIEEIVRNVVCFSSCEKLEIFSSYFKVL